MSWKLRRSHPLAMNCLYDTGHKPLQDTHSRRLSGLSGDVRVVGHRLRMKNGRELAKTPNKHTIILDPTGHVSSFLPLLLPRVSNFFSISAFEGSSSRAWLKSCFAPSKFLSLEGRGRIKSRGTAHVRLPMSDCPCSLKQCTIRIPACVRDDAFSTKLPCYCSSVRMLERHDHFLQANCWRCACPRLRIAAQQQKKHRKANQEQNMRWVQGWRRSSEPWNRIGTGVQIERFHHSCIFGQQFRASGDNIVPQTSCFSLSTHHSSKRADQWPCDQATNARVSRSRLQH